MIVNLFLLTTRPQKALHAGRQVNGETGSDDANMAAEGPGGVWAAMAVKIIVASFLVVQNKKN